ncbi:endonuclease III [Candidatus Thorarchaeota archaeon]|nr:MAG: endonuclease III [Candidatus Thorarchaeota archaeon]
MVDETRKKAEKICKALIREYGDEVSERKLPPIDELVMTILSQHTNDVNMFRAFESLKATYSTWDEVLAAPQDELANSIRSSGMYNLKAKRIQATLREIQERVGKLDLSLLEKMEIPQAKEWLTSLHGVGPKTAAIVLLFSFGLPVLPVDTHVWRVTKRLGIIDETVSREKAHDLLEHIMPRTCISSLNKNLVQHGREVCKAQNPRCDKCFLSILCLYYSEVDRT